MRTASLICAIVLGTPMALGCADDDAGDGADSDADADTDTDSDADGDTDTDADSDTDSDSDTDVSWSHAEDIQPIWNATCSPCHIGDDSGGLSLADPAYGNIVGVVSDQSDLDLVEPGDAGASYLWHKLAGTQGSVGGSGVKMPASGTIGSGDLDAIESWIGDGAQP